MSPTRLEEIQRRSWTVARVMDNLDLSIQTRRAVRRLAVATLAVDDVPWLIAELRASREREATLRAKIEALTSYDIDMHGRREEYTLDDPTPAPWGEWIKREDVLAIVASRREPAPAFDLSWSLPNKHSLMMVSPPEEAEPA